MLGNANRMLAGKPQDKIFLGSCTKKELILGLWHTNRTKSDTPRCCKGR